MTVQHDIHDSQDNLRDNDEIDLLALVRSALSTWRTVVFSLMLVSMLYGGFKAIKVAFLPGEITYSKPIRLTFKGSDKLEFPSGARFSYGDIIAPAVVSVVHERNHLSEYGLTAEVLQRSLSAEPYSPTYPLIIERYQKKLSDKKLTVEQVSELETNMRSDIKQATLGSVLISMHLEKVRLPKDVASKVLADIPAVWAERTIRDKGVLDINIPIATAKTLNVELIEHVEYMIVSDLLKEKLGLLRKNIASLSEAQGVETVKDPVTGMSLYDLTTALDDLGKYVIDEVLSPIRYLGLTKDNKLSVFYYEEKLKRLDMELALLENQANLAKQAYDSYTQQQNQGSVDSPQKGTALMAPQIDNDLLDRLVAMSSDIDREKYRQKLNQQWLNFNLSAADVKNSIADTKQVLTSLKTVNNSSARSGVEDAYLDRVKDALPEILKKLSSYFDITDRIYQQLSIESVGVRDQLYIPVTNSVLVERDGIELKQTFIIWAALMFLTVIVAVPTTMIARALKTNKGA